MRTGTTTLFVVPARAVTWLAESIPRNRFLGSIDVYKHGLSILAFSTPYGILGGFGVLGALIRFLNLTQEPMKKKKSVAILSQIMAFGVANRMQVL